MKSKERTFILALARFLKDNFTFNEIAELFFRSGLVNKLEKPYSEYDGTKYDYAVEKLTANPDKNVGFYEEILPQEFTRIEYLHGVDSAFKRELKSMGYTIKKRIEEINVPDIGEVEDVYYDLIPPKEISTEKPRSPKQLKEYLKKHAVYPKKVNGLIDELNINISFGNGNASALLVRRILFIASVKYALENNFEKDIQDENGDYIELSKILAAIGKKSPDVTVQLLNRLQIAKWMSDYANHNFTWEVDRGELEIALTNMRAFLDALYKD